MLINKSCKDVGANKTSTLYCMRFDVVALFCYFCLCESAMAG